MTRRDRSVLRDLAMRVAEIAELPVMAQRRADWIRHNKLEPVRPMILVFPEGSWRELLPDSAIVCEDDSARDVERDLRRRLFYHEGMFDEKVKDKKLSECQALFTVHMYHVLTELIEKLKKRD